MQHVGATQTRCICRHKLLHQQVTFKLEIASEKDGRNNISCKKLCMFQETGNSVLNLLHVRFYSLLYILDINIIQRQVTHYRNGMTIPKTQCV